MKTAYHAKGRVFHLYYEYAIKDHLGNTRLWVSDLDGDGILETPSEILQEKHFYPFGMAMEGPWMESSANPVNKYQYNGKELHTEFGLNLMDYGARWYDAAVGRFLSTDPLAENYIYQSTYTYAANNPISNIDILGMASASVNDLISDTWNKTPNGQARSYDNNGNEIEKEKNNEFIADGYTDENGKWVWSENETASYYTDDNGKKWFWVTENKKVWDIIINQIDKIKSQPVENFYMNIIRKFDHPDWGIQISGEDLLNVVRSPAGSPVRLLDTEYGIWLVLEMEKTFTSDRKGIMAPFPANRYFEISISPYDSPKTPIIIPSYYNLGDFRNTTIENQIRLFLFSDYIDNNRTH